VIRDELRRALETVGGALPGGEVVVLMRRAFGDRGITFIRGDVEGVTGRDATCFEGPLEGWLEILHPDDREGVEERLATLPHAERLRLEYRIVQPGEGGTRWIREHLRTIRSKEGAPPEVVGLLTDVSFARTAGAKIAHLEDDLWRARRLESVGNVTTGIAHDFNNLLTVVLASTDLLRSLPEMPGEAIEDIHAIREAVGRGRRLVRQLLSFASRTPGESDGVSLGRAVRDLEAILAKTLGTKVELAIEIEAELWEVAVDRAHLEQVVFNLVVNAAEAMRGPGAVSVEVANEEVEEDLELDRGRLRSGRHLRLTVRDTGPGIAPEERARVFEPFYSTKERERAGGLGLATVARIVAGYGGAIRLETEVGEGTAFHLYFPVREDASHATREIQVAGSVEEPRDGGARILVVEDDPLVQSEVERILVRQGHSVVVASTAGDGLQVFDRVRPPFDLLIADVLLPDRSGPHLHRALLRRVPDLPAIFLSERGREEAAREGFESDRGVLLDKPFDAEELLRAVAARVSPVRTEGETGRSEAAGEET